MKQFKLFGGAIIEDINAYIKDYLEKDPDTLVYVGTDSQQVKRKTIYATVIVLYKPTKGGHIVFKRERITKIRNTFERLWREAELSLSVAKEIKEVVESYNKIVTIDIDYNSDEQYKSNSVLKAALGYLISEGFNVRNKPDAFAASCSADLLCHR